MPAESTQRRKSPRVPPAPPPATGGAAERQQRSRTMAAVPSQYTSLEQQLAAFMWAVGIRGWRRNLKVGRARPDFAFPRQKVAVFVDGCFWHGCPECGRRPSSNTSYWTAKLDRNIERDDEQTKRLRSAGWTVLRFWGHEIERDSEGIAFRLKPLVGSS
ncbi:MAG TPA: very short patch repair endonuclease [Solirubrobacteraceae bacterium]